MARYTKNMAKPSSGKLRFAIVAVDAATFRIVDGKLCVLLGKVNVPPFYKNRWGLVGGLIQPHEDATQAIVRHLRAKAGMQDLYKEQLYTFSGIKRDPRGRVVSVAFLALLPEEGAIGEGAIETRWYPIEDVPTLAYDHAEILAMAVERLRNRFLYTNIVRYLMPKEFTLSELQAAYETVLKKKLDKRNFRKWLSSLKVVRDTGKQRRKGAQRPAALYAFSASGLRVFELS